MSKSLLVTVLLAMAGTQPVAAQVHRCTMPDGVDVYTDRACPDVGAVEQAPKAAPPAVARARTGGCARNLRDLVHEINGAFDARDANRLAGVYHWAGMSGSNAYDVLARLDALVQLPLVGIVPVMPAESGDEAAAMEAAPLFEEDPVIAPPRPRRPPVALRVEQTQANGITPARTVFGLQKHFGCWWIKG
ncbi:hypothetical protein MNR01_07555 [Lysobacter sp. S4-A87]|uniref:hypothetical protein n=1 Tax=Lysobacter sp. S4-A87 TaxID=2925843 RepID=UPI001F539FFD|nr:hypothetical protein [Lysobacter sp. S4-A87]UNK50846.1 hypothetical protein MNR01_07555 [Lysobacter sp. S4-A87]